jgi:integrase
MGRNGGVWPRGGGGAWHTTLAGQKRWLAPAGATQEFAERQRQRLLEGLPLEPFDQDAGRPAPVLLAVAASAPPSLDGLVAEYIEEQQRRVDEGNLEQATLDRYVEMLAQLRVLGPLRADQVTADQVRALLRDRKWNRTYSNFAGKVLKIVLNWGVAANRLPANPLRGWKLPTPERRRTAATADQVVRLLEACACQEHRDFLAMLTLTGCRPSEAARVTARDFDAARGLFVLHKHKAARYHPERPRVILVPPALRPRVVELLGLRPDGPLLRNADGAPWNKNGWGRLFQRLVRRAGLARDLTAYTLRHGYITDALESQAPGVVAALAGHSSLKQIDTYNHLNQRVELLSGAAGRVRPDTAPASLEPVPQRSARAESLDRATRRQAAAQAAAARRRDSA